MCDQLCYPCSKQKKNRSNSKTKTTIILISHRSSLCIIDFTNTAGHGFYKGIDEANINLQPLLLQGYPKFLKIFRAAWTFIDQNLELLPYMFNWIEVG